MLKSLRNPAPLTVLSVIQSHNCSTATGKSVKKRSGILRTRTDQKQLYGDIIRTTPTAKPSKKVENVDSGAFVDQLHGSNVEVSEMKLASSAQSSEFYWLFQKGTAKNYKVYKSNNGANATKTKERTISYKPINTPQESTNRMTSNQDSPFKQQTSQTTVISAKNAIISAKNLIQGMMTNKGTASQKQTGRAIPFDEATLNSILSYPLVGSKGRLDQTESLLTDRTLYLPSISKVLQATMPESSRIALRKWKLAKIAELGIDGFKEYEKETLNRGKEFHSAIENYLSQGTIPTPDSAIIKLWESIDNSLKALEPKPVLLEQPILHADLKYKGIIDNVSIVKNELCAFEWKTSEKAKPRLTSTYDAPVQLCAYLGALNVDPRYDLTVKNGRVVVAYKNGDAANVFDLTESDLRKYWLIWLKRLQEYWIRFRDGTLPDPI